MREVLDQYDNGLISKGEALAFLSNLLMLVEKREVDALWLRNQGYVP